MDKWVSLAPLYLKCGAACGMIASLQLLLPSTAPSPSFLPFPPPCLASTSLLSLHPSLFLPSVPSLSLPPSFLPVSLVPHSYPCIPSSSFHCPLSLLPTLPSSPPRFYLTPSPPSSFHCLLYLHPSFFLPLSLPPELFIAMS